VPMIFLAFVTGVHLNGSAESWDPKHHAPSIPWE
jgi:hypothetical protein